MKRLIFFAFLLFLTYLGSAQEILDRYPVSHDKLIIDSSTYKNWPSVKSGVISNNGSYAFYIVNSKSGRQLGVIKECVGDWETRIDGVLNFQFTTDNRYAVCGLRDTLCIIRLGGDSREEIPMRRNCQFFRVASKEWVTYQNEFKNELVIRNIKTGEKKDYNHFVASSDGRSFLLDNERGIGDHSISPSLSILDLPTGNLFNVWRGNYKKNEELSRQISFLDIKSFCLSPDKKSVVLECGGVRTDSGYTTIYRLNLLAGTLEKLWSGMGLLKFISNFSADELVLLLEERSNNDKSLWFKRERQESVKLVSDSSLFNAASLVLNDLDSFSRDDRFVFYSTKKLTRRVKVDDNVSDVTIWSYLDEKLQSIQKKEEDNIKVYASAINLKSGHSIQIEEENDYILGHNNDWYLITHLSGGGSGIENRWNSTAEYTYLLKHLSTKECIPINFKGNYPVSLSPEGRFVLYYDSLYRNYFSYEISTKVYRNITAGIDVSWINSYREDLAKAPRYVAGWVKGDKVLIYDRFDIWMIDLAGKQLPLNITHGLGLKENIIFSLGLLKYSNKIFFQSDTLILNAISLDDMKNGYYKVAINSRIQPKRLTMGDYIYHLIDNPYVHNRGIYPLESANGGKFMLLRMASDESPNYFFTTDFVRFMPISSIHPEKSYNWFKTELHTWRKPDGALLKGILYKPDNFDSTKRYPIIFHYYEKKSFSLNEYLVPNDISDFCNVNIPTIVSNGYLVFTPDIIFRTGEPMQSAYESVVSAAEYMSNKTYVNQQKMGIGGCSFGGMQTNYIVTHSKLFAAAYASSSLADFVSAYGDIPVRFEGLNDYFEVGQMRMGGTLWEVPDRYIKNSPIFSVDKVVTPLLLMHTTNDGVCSFSNVLELYTALRRLGKRSWLLEYSEGNHGIMGRSAVDFGIRLNQFFDHYLKDKPAPEWMTRGIPAKMKGIDNGYKYDPEIRTPGKGLLYTPSLVK